MVSTKPAVLLMTDGPPIIGPIQGTKLSYVVNTNWDLIKEDDDYYLLNSAQWLKVQQPRRPLETDWEATEGIPQDSRG